MEYMDTLAPILKSYPIIFFITITFGFLIFNQKNVFRIFFFNSNRLEKFLCNEHADTTDIKALKDIQVAKIWKSQGMAYVEGAKREVIILLCNYFKGGLYYRQVFAAHKHIKVDKEEIRIVISKSQNAIYYLYVGFAIYFYIQFCFFMLVFTHYSNQQLPFKSILTFLFIAGFSIVFCMVCVYHASPTVCAKMIIKKLGSEKITMKDLRKE